MIWLLAAAMLTAGAAPRSLVVIGVREPLLTLNPFTALTIEAYRATGLVIEPLAKVDPRSDRLRPWLATNWARRGRTLRVSLRPRVSFHDGRALTAKDVVTTFERFRDPANGAVTWWPLFEGIVRARALGPRLVAFDADREWTYERVRNLLTHLRIRPAHGTSRELIGTGPFRAPVDGVAPLLFRGFGGWWRKPRPSYDLVFKAVTDETLARALVARGELDYYPALRPGPNVQEVSGGEAFWIDLNVRRPPFDDRRVREALLLLWDRADLNQKLFHGERVVALDSFEPSTAHYPPGRATSFDPERAHALLESAGWRRRGAGWRRGEETLAFELLVATSEQERWASFFQAALAREGIAVRLQRRALDGRWWKVLHAGDFDAAAGSGPLSPVVNPDAWRSNGGYNAHGLKDPALDQALDRQDVEFNERRREANARRLIERVRGHLVQLPGLLYPRRRVLLSKRARPSVENPEDFAAWRLE